MTVPAFAEFLLVLLDKLNDYSNGGLTIVYGELMHFAVLQTPFEGSFLLEDTVAEVELFFSFDLVDGLHGAEPGEVVFQLQFRDVSGDLSDEELPEGLGLGVVCSVGQDRDLPRVKERLLTPQRPFEALSV